MANNRIHRANPDHALDASERTISKDAKLLCQRLTRFVSHLSLGRVHKALQDFLMSIQQTV